MQQYKEQGRKVILVGHSLGGPLIVRIAADYPGTGRRPDHLCRFRFTGAGAQQLVPSCHCLILCATWFRAGLLVSNNELMVHKDDLVALEPLWKNIHQPVIIIQGTHDNLVPAGNADFARQHLINASVDVRMIEGMNHFFVWTKPELIRQAVGDMLAKIDD